jgi:hypothetical protein
MAHSVHWLTYAPKSMWLLKESAGNLTEEKSRVSLNFPLASERVYLMMTKYSTSLTNDDAFSFA